ncbi:MAG: bifunctional metallophosphatase/5'-nucleotidase [Steroidobacteraceae bacterium]
MTSKLSTLLVLTIAATFPELSHGDPSHSLESDQHDERAESDHARSKASERVTLRDARWKKDPVVRVKLLGINDFHGQLSPRAVGARPAGGAAVLTSYLKAASAAVQDGALIIHAGDHVGASPPNSALLQDEPSISVLNSLANDACRQVPRHERLPDWVVANLFARCNVVGTFGNHEFDEGIGEALRLVYGGNHPEGPFLQSPWRGARFPYTRAENTAGESALGNLIADAQGASGASAFAFMNAGGIRDDLNAGEVTWGELFAIQPFANDLVSMDLTGAQIKTLLEQQWQGQTAPRILKTSGLTYTWDATRPVGDRVVSIVDAAGTALDPGAIYRVTVNSFIAAGGDNFTVLASGTNHIVGAVDLDALVDYIPGLSQPFAVQVEGRILRVN